MSDRTTAGGEKVVAGPAPKEYALPGRAVVEDRFDDEMTPVMNAAYFYSLGRQVKHLCVVCGISEGTFYRWKKTEEFQDHYEQFRSRLMEHGYNKATMRATELIDSEDEGISLKASIAVMQHVVALRRDRQAATGVETPTVVVQGNMLALGTQEAMDVIARGREQLASMESGKRVEATVEVEATPEPSDTAPSS
jgi:hypothetical protein